MRVLRVYHAGRDPAHRARDRALAALGVDVVLVVPETWPESGAQRGPVIEPGLGVVEMAVRRPGDVNRHTHAEDVTRVLRRVRPDLLDLHEEPFAAVTRQWLAAAPGRLPVVGYTAQNLDKRFPPPFAQHEQAALRRLRGMYPCSRQAASVAVGKGFAGHVEVLPLGYEPRTFTAGEPPLSGASQVVLVGRLVTEKGVLDAVQAVAAVPGARLVLAGDGPALDPARALSARLGASDRLEHRPWLDACRLAALLRTSRVLLVPSRSTGRWVEQYGRVVTEAQASGCVVVGYASGALAESGGRAALLVAEGDVDGLTQALATVLSDLDEWRRRRALGLQQVQARTWEAVARRQLALWERVLAEPPVPASAVGRSAARLRFGEPARVPGGLARPFALPVMRDLRMPQPVRRPSTSA